eukprot:6648316-Pyramimonas_sp.AAC.1
MSPTFTASQGLSSASTSDSDSWSSSLATDPCWGRHCGYEAFGPLRFGYEVGYASWVSGSRPTLGFRSLGFPTL